MGYIIHLTQMVGAMVQIAGDMIFLPLQGIGHTYAVRKKQAAIMEQDLRGKAATLTLKKTKILMIVQNHIGTRFKLA